MSNASCAHSTLLPQTGLAPGQLLWGEAPRRQPIAPLILMAVLLLLVAAPTAMGGNGGSSNPIALMRDIANSTYELTGLIQGSNESLVAIDTNSKHLIDLQANMAGISAATSGMADKTAKLNELLGEVGAAVAGSRAKLGSVDAKLAETAKGMTAKRGSVGGSLAATQGIVKEFSTIDDAIGTMDAQLKLSIGEMAKSAPLTKSFANNTTRKEIAGGNGAKYGVQNLAPNNRVMTVMLGMIATMQKGGPLPARKDRHTGSNPIVNTALKLQVPDGVNVVALVRPFDGFYGLPDENFFVQHKIHGF